MGNSSMEGKEWTRSYISLNCSYATKILDIGPGQGTYWYLLKDVVPAARWTGVEVFQPYIEYFKLDSIYHTIYNMDIREFSPIERYDFVIAGDVLEHMTAEEAVDVVDKFLPVCDFMVVSLPIVHWPQDAVNGNPWEVHVVDDWSHQKMMDVFGRRISSFYNGTHIGVYIMNNNLTSSDTFV